MTFNRVVVGLSKPAQWKWWRDPQRLLIYLCPLLQHQSRLQRPTGIIYLLNYSYIYIQSICCRLIGKTDKPGGPPVQRLFSATGPSTPSTPSDYHHLPSTPHANYSVNSQVDQSDTFEDSDAGTWVTVFGFPPTAASYVLTQTTMWGHTLEHRIRHSGGQYCH